MILWHFTKCLRLTFCQFPFCPPRSHAFLWENSEEQKRTNPASWIILPLCQWLDSGWSVSWCLKSEKHTLLLSADKGPFPCRLPSSTMFFVTAYLRAVPFLCARWDISFHQQIFSCPTSGSRPRNDPWTNRKLPGSSSSANLSHKNKFQKKIFVFSGVLVVKLFLCRHFVTVFPPQMGSQLRCSPLTCERISAFTESLTLSWPWICTEPYALWTIF